MAWRYTWSVADVFSGRPDPSPVIRATVRYEELWAALQYAELLAVTAHSSGTKPCQCCA